MYVHEFSGHHQAALAIERALVSAAPETETCLVDTVRYVHPILEQFVRRIYLEIIKKKPELWEYLYDNPKILQSTSRLKHTFHQSYSGKFDRLLKDFKPTDVVCTQAFPCGVMSDYKKSRDFQAPLYAVLTDYAPHGYWFAENVDRYFVPSAEAKGKLVADGAAAEKVLVTGIPVSVTTPSKETRRLPRVIVMGGSQGIGPIERIVGALDELDDNFEILVLAGRNQKLLRRLEKKKWRKKTIIEGYVEDTASRFRRADILISKPGGLTVAQSLAMGLPLIFIDPIPGQEAKNAAYLLNQKAALGAASAEAAAAHVSDLLHSSEKMESLKKKMALLAKPDAAADIARIILK